LELQNELTICLNGEKVDLQEVENLLLNEKTPVCAKIKAISKLIKLRNDEKVKILPEALKVYFSTIPSSYALLKNRRILDFIKESEDLQFEDSTGKSLLEESIKFNEVLTKNILEPAEVAKKIKRPGKSLLEESIKFNKVLTKNIIEPAEVAKKIKRRCLLAGVPCFLTLLVFYTTFLKEGKIKCCLFGVSLLISFCYFLKVFGPKVKYCMAQKKKRFLNKPKKSVFRHNEKSKLIKPESPVYLLEYVLDRVKDKSTGFEFIQLKTARRNNNLATCAIHAIKNARLLKRLLNSTTKKDRLKIHKSMESYNYIKTYLDNFKAFA